MIKEGRTTMNPVLSIIVPVYNAEKYLNRCVDSILNQEYTDFELLLVNDGSSDSSGDICDSYALRDSRVRVIHKDNSGVSDTRNQAMAQACGTYIQFLDSDDWITPDASKLLVRAAENYHCDLVVADFYRVSGNRVSHKGDIEDDVVLTREAYAEHMMENPADYYYGVIWNKLYRRDIIEKNHLKMSTKLNWCEDFLFNLEYILHAKTFFALQTPIYYYVKTKGSLVSQNATILNTVRMKFTIFEYYNQFYKHVLDEKEYEKSRLQVYRFLIQTAGDGLVLPSPLPGSARLGTERENVYGEAVDSEGIPADLYRDRKLLNICLEPVSIKNDLSLDETRLLLYLSHVRVPLSRRELADYTGMSRQALVFILQKLAGKNLINVEERKPEKSATKHNPAESPRSLSTGRKLSVTFLPLAAPLLKELADVQNEYDRIRFQGLDTEELITYARLNEKITENIRQILQQYT